MYSYGELNPNSCFERALSWPLDDRSILNSFLVDGRPQDLHHFLIVLSVTPYISPIDTKVLEVIKLNNSSFEGLSSNFTLWVALCFDAHDPHLVEVREISFPQSTQ